MKKTVVKWLYSLVDDDALRQLIVRHKVPVAGFDNNLAKAPRERLILSLSQGRKVPKILKDLKKIVSDISDEDVLVLSEIELGNMIREKGETLPGILITLFINNDPQYHEIAESLFEEFKQDETINGKIKAAVEQKKKNRQKRVVKTGPSQMANGGGVVATENESESRLQARLDKAKKIILKQRHLLVTEKANWDHERTQILSEMKGSLESAKDLTEKLKVAETLLKEKEKENASLHKTLTNYKQSNELLKEEKCKLEQTIHQVELKMNELLNTSLNKPLHNYLLIGQGQDSSIAKQYPFVTYISEDDLLHSEEGWHENYERILLSNDTCTTLGHVKVARMAGDKAKVFSTLGQLMRYLEEIV